MTRKQWAILMLLLLFSTGIRFYNLTDIGIKQVDEATYLLEGQWMNGDDHARMPYKLTSSKPLFSYLISLNLRLFGNVDYAGILVSAISGSLTVAVVFLIGYFAYSYNIGLAASAIIAFNKLHIYFSRNGYAESLMLFFFSLALLFYILSQKEKNRTLFLSLAGLCTGLSYNAKFLGALMLGIIFINEAINAYFYKRKWRDAAYNFLVPLAVFTGVFIITWLLYAMAGQSYMFYFLHRVDQIDIGSKVLNSIPYVRDIPRFPDSWVAGSNMLFESLAYIFYTYKTFTLLSLAMAAAGIYYMFRSRKPMDVLFLVSLIFITLLVWKIAYGRPRTLMFFPLLVAMCASVGIAKASEYFKKSKRAVFWSLAAVLSLAGLAQSIDVISYSNTGFREASAYVVENGGTTTLSTNWQVMAFYSGYYSTNICNGSGYVVIDTWKLQMYPKDHCFWEIYENQDPLYSIPHRIDAWQYPITELRALRALNLDMLAGRLDSAFATKKSDYEILIYSPQSI